MARSRNLQPWLDYFDMLQQYCKDGFLLVDTENHEARITRVALFTVAGYSDDPEALADRSPQAISRRLAAMKFALLRIRDYAAWLSREGKDYISRPFAIHAEEDSSSAEPGRRRFTVVITTKRRWWKLWQWHDHLDITSYD